MGAVYEAVDARGARVAVKLLSARLATGDYAERFAREAAITASLSSPHIARVLDSGVDRALGAPYLVMELLSGVDLEAALQDASALAPAAAIRIALRVCRGLEVAHAAGVVHRDIKPANVFLHRLGGGAFEVKVCDFGIAKELFADTSMTSTGDVFGSPTYMSPEQARSSKHVDARTDVWSVGALLYELLSGRTPFGDTTNIPELLVLLTTREVPPLQARAPWVPAALARVVHGALLRDVGARCPNVSALRDALLSLVDDTGPLDAALLAPAPAELRARREPVSRQPASWREIEAELPPPPRAEASASEVVRLLGRTFGRGYPLLRVLGRGGMGAVYETRGQRDERLAIKVVADEERHNPEALRRLVSEARAVMAITSDHVVKVFEADADPEQRTPFIVMELLEGQDLGALLRAGAPLEAAAAARIFTEACRGLDAAHRLGIIHRDVKPANLFLHELPSGEITTKVCDFGVAKKLFATDTEHTAMDLTRTGGILGSPMYFSPEQSRNAKHVDHRTDVWSLGASLYEALSGRKPWEGCESVGDIIVALATQEVQPLAVIAPWVPPGLAAVVHRTLSRDPDARYASMADLAAALEPFASPGRLVRAALRPVRPEARAGAAPSAPRAAPTAVLSRRPRSIGAAIAAASVAAVIGAGVAALAVSRSTAEPPRVEPPSLTAAMHDEPEPIAAPGESEPREPPPPEVAAEEAAAAVEPDAPDPSALARPSDERAPPAPRARAPVAPRPRAQAASPAAHPRAQATDPDEFVRTQKGNP